MAEEQELTPLFSVEFVLLVEGQGLTALCCFPNRAQAQIRPGDAIEFIRPDKIILQTTALSVKTFESIGMFEDGRPGLVGLVLPNDIQKEEIPRGSMLRLVRACDSAEG